MRKPPSFFVATGSILFVLSFTLAACEGSAVQSSADPAPSSTRSPVNQVYTLAWAPDGIRLALGTKHGDIQLWDTRSKTLLRTAKQRFGEIYALAWSPDGKELASGGQDQAVHLWDTTTGQQTFAYRSRESQGKC
jgi:WD40 repeat protein